MRFVALDWGTSRCRAFLVDGAAIQDQASSDEGVSRLRAGEHAAVFSRLCGSWLAAEPDLPVVIAGMAGSREGWVEAPYAACPAGPADIAAAMIPVALPTGGIARIVPGLRFDGPHGVDVMRGEETHLVGTGVADGLVCLPGTHCKWAEMRAGRIVRFATFMTGEMHALLREHSMIGRPAAEPADEAGFALGLEAAWDEQGRRGGLLNLLFRARAATVAHSLPRERLGPYLSGLLTGDEISGALRLFGPPGEVTIVADRPRADHYVEALRRRGVETRVIAPRQTLLTGLRRLLTEMS
jgi:2-dehydro-3-deoxygalactonokinase